MRDIPIIFSAPMVKALLADRKTMTRRYAWRSFNKDDAELFPSPWTKVVPGDRLWVKETFVHYREKCKDSSTGFVDWVHYRATDEDDFKPGMKWKPSIFMPRQHSRITLVVTATKIEPLQAINEDDAMAEGIIKSRVALPGGNEALAWFGVPHVGDTNARNAFKTLWNMLHGEMAWRDNPEVVASTFTVHKCNIDKLKLEAAA